MGNKAGLSSNSLPYFGAVIVATFVLCGLFWLDVHEKRIDEASTQLNQLQRIVQGDVKGGLKRDSKDFLIWKIYFVSLPDNERRLQLMERQLKHADIEYQKWPGLLLGSIAKVSTSWERIIAKSQLPKDPWQSEWHTRPPCWSKDTTLASKPMLGSVAASLSHIAVLDAMRTESKSSPDRAVFVLLEDDCLLHQGWQDKLEMAMSSAPEGWDVIRLGWYGDLDPADIVNEYFLRVSSVRYSGMYATLISKKGIERLLEWWGKHSICWTDQTIYSESLHVYALRTKLASELHQIGKGRSNYDS